MAPRVLANGFVVRRSFAVMLIVMETLYLLLVASDIRMAGGALIKYLQILRLPFVRCRGRGATESVKRLLTTRSPPLLPYRKRTR